LDELPHPLWLVFDLLGGQVAHEFVVTLGNACEFQNVISFHQQGNGSEAEDAGAIYNQHCNMTLPPLSNEHSSDSHSKNEEREEQQEESHSTFKLFESILTFLQMITP